MDDIREGQSEIGLRKKPGSNMHQFRKRKNPPHNDSVTADHEEARCRCLHTWSQTVVRFHLESRGRIRERRLQSGVFPAFKDEHAALEESPKLHYFFSGFGATIEDKQPAKNERGRNAMAFSALPPDSQAFIKGNYTALIP